MQLVAAVNRMLGGPAITELELIAMTEKVLAESVTWNDANAHHTSLTQFRESFPRTVLTNPDRNQVKFFLLLFCICIFHSPPFP